MSRKSRRQASRQTQQQLLRAIQTHQDKEVQGPSMYNQPPQVATVQLAANLEQKYLGVGMAGFGPSLQVLSNRGASELVCQHGYELLRKMSDDGEVDASLDALIQASTGYPLTLQSPITPDDPDYKLAKKYADFATHVFSDIPIDDWRREQLRNALTFGNACSEVDWTIRTDDEGEPRFWIKRLRVQAPENYGYLVDRWGEIYGVVPMGAAAFGQYPLGNIVQLTEDQFRQLKGVVPRYKLSIWTWDQRNNDPRGTSILIPAYVPWWSKQRTIEEWSCWLGRYAQPSIWGTPGPNALPYCPPGHQTPVQPTEALLQALLQFKSASALALPYGSQLELLTVEGGVDPFVKSIEIWNKEITRSILGQHLATSEGGVQSRTGAEIHALVLRQLISSIRQFMIRQITHELVKPLIEANFGDVGRLMPFVNLGDADGFPPSVTEIALLFQAGYFSEDQLPFLDKVLGLPIRTTFNRVGAGNLPKDDISGLPTNADGNVQADDGKKSSSVKTNDVPTNQPGP